MLEGSVRKSENRARITVQLIDATTGNHLWAERYDRELSDIFAVQGRDYRNRRRDDRATALCRRKRTGPAERPPESLDAWGLAMRAMRHLWNMTEVDNVRAQELLLHGYTARSELRPGVWAAWFSR